jgi:hypothetical protein
LLNELEIIIAAVAGDLKRKSGQFEMKLDFLAFTYSVQDVAWFVVAQNRSLVSRVTAFMYNNLWRICGLT